MRKVVLAVIVCLLVAGGAVAALAQSQTAVTVTAKVTPNRAGTKERPQPVKLQVDFKWAILENAEQPIVQTFDVLFPKGSQYNGGKYPKCTENTLSRSGPQGCPKGSIMGSGTGNAFADTVVTHPRITVVNGGSKRVYFYTVLNNPARVQAPVPGVITKRSGKWAYRLQVKVPQVLQVVAGVPIQLTSLTVKAGKGSWLATTSCGPGGKWPYSVTTGYSTGGSSTDTSSISCRR